MHEKLLNYFSSILKKLIYVGQNKLLFSFLSVSEKGMNVGESMLLYGLIESKDISFVIQGAITQKITEYSILKIRQYFPEAEIILSTWEGADVDGLNVDRVILNEDPKSELCDASMQIYNNTNRQLISTQEGIKAVTRKYTCKLRTDFWLKGNNFIKYWDQFPLFNNKYRIFKHRVLCCSLVSREFSPENSRPMPFHVGDFWFFGLTEDIKDYFLNTPLLSKVDQGNFKYKHPDRVPFENLYMRYAPEQFFSLNHIKRHFYNFEFDDWTDFNVENIKLSQNYLYNNFIFLDPKEIKLCSEKHKKNLKIVKNIPGLITFPLFQQRYKEMINNSDVTFSQSDVQRTIDYRIKREIKRIQKRIRFLISPFSFLLELIITIPLVVVNLCRLFILLIKHKLKQ